MSQEMEFGFGTSKCYKCGMQGVRSDMIKEFQDNQIRYRHPFDCTKNALESKQYPKIAKLAGTYILFINGTIKPFKSLPNLAEYLNESNKEPFNIRALSIFDQLELRELYQIKK